MKSTTHSATVCFSPAMTVKIHPVPNPSKGEKETKYESLNPIVKYELFRANYASVGYSGRNVDAYGSVPNVLNFDSSRKNYEDLTSYRQAA